MSDNIIRRAAKRLVNSPEFLETFTDLFVLELERQLSSEAGGDRVYIAKNSGNADKEARDAQIQEKCKGNNFAQLGKEYNLSEKQIRRICRKGYPKKTGTFAA